jgi:hypothetical protein
METSSVEGVPRYLHIVCIMVYIIGTISIFISVINYLTAPSFEIYKEKFITDILTAASKRGPLDENVSQSLRSVVTSVNAEKIQRYSFFQIAAIINLIIGSAAIHSQQQRGLLIFSIGIGIGIVSPFIVFNIGVIGLMFSVLHLFVWVPMLILFWVNKKYLK